jgi:hypothetical protein
LHIKKKYKLTKEETAALEDNLIAQAFIKATEIDTGLSLFSRTKKES